MQKRSDAAEKKKAGSRILKLTAAADGGGQARDIRPAWVEGRM